MGLYLIKRTDEDDMDYDEFEAVLIRHESAEAARQYVLDARETIGGRSYPVYIGMREGNIAVTEITGEGEPGEIIRDFRAG